MKFYLYLSILILILNSGCYENIDSTPIEPDVIIQTSEVYVTTQISGSVMDLEKNTLTDYYLSINGINQDIPSDYFLIELEEARKKGQTIRVHKDGNQIGLKTELILENDINYIIITAHDKFQNSIKPKAEANIKIRKDLSIEFSNSSFSTNYIGDIDIEYVDIASQINLTTIGYDFESHLLAVDSKGGFYAKIYDDNGNELEITPTEPAKLTIGDLDEDVNGLFALNEKTDIWELISDISPNSEIEIRARGYYTFAKYTKGVFIEGSISKEGEKVAYQPMRWNNSGLENDLRATEKGKYIGLLPENKVVAIEILNPCDESLQSESIDINNNDLSNQNLDITNNESYQYLNSTIIDCEGNLISNTTINIHSDNTNHNYIFSETGQNRWIPVCGDFNIAAVDQETNELGTVIEWSTEINEPIDLLSGCSEHTGGFSYLKIRDDERVYPAFNIEQQDGRTILSAVDGEIKIFIKGNTIGKYEEDQINIIINDEMFGETGYYIQCENSNLGCGIKNFEITHFDMGSNGQVRAKFSGEVWMQTLSPNLAGTYPVEGVIVSKI